MRRDFEPGRHVPDVGRSGSATSPQNSPILPKFAPPPSIKQIARPTSTSAHVIQQTSGSKTAGPKFAPVPVIQGSTVGAHDASTRPTAPVPVSPRVGKAMVVQRLKQTLVQHGAMSGDQFQVAVALMLDPELRLILIGEHGANKQDKSDSIYKFYTQQSGISPNRIAFMKVSGKMEDRVKKILAGRPEDATSSDKKEDFFDQSVASVGQATNVVRDLFKASNRTEDVRKAWLSQSGMDETTLGRLVREWRVPLQKPMVVLWSRQSGALGGLHPEHDSSYSGLAQLVDRFSTADNTVVIVGDDPGLKIRGRYQFSFLTGSAALHQAQEEQKRRRFEKAVAWGEFWERSGLRGKPRTAQFAFFEYIRQLVPTLTHVGMRSGNLEAYAYMGHRVIFLEEANRADRLRMDKLLEQGVNLKYRSVKLTELPTRTGRVLMEENLNQRWVLGRLGKLYETLNPGPSANAKAKKRAVALQEKIGPVATVLLTIFRMRERGISGSALPDYQKDLSLYRLLKEFGFLIQILRTRNELSKPFAIPAHSGFVGNDLNQIIDVQDRAFRGKNLFEDS